MPGSPSPFCTSTIFRALLTFSDKACSCQCMFKLTVISSPIHHLPWLGGPCSSIKAFSSYVVWLDPERISHSTSSRAQEAGSRYASLPVCHLAYKAQAWRWSTSEEVLHYFSNLFFIIISCLLLLHNFQLVGKRISHLFLRCQPQIHDFQNVTLVASERSFLDCTWNRLYLAILAR